MNLFDRRDFLKAGAAASAYSMLWNLLPPPRRKPGEAVLVIGAGMAGIAAARALKAGGHRVVILEGRDRVGGRVWTDRSLGHPIDLGASWIHGVDGNPITKLTDEFKAETRATDYDDVVIYDKDGTRLSRRDAEEISDAYDELTDAVAEIGEDADRDLSIGEAIERVLKRETLDAEERRALNWAIAGAVVESGAEMRELSLLHSDDDEGFDGGDRLFPGGYDAIVAKCAEGLDVKTGHRVSKIEHGGKGVRVTTDKGVFEGDRAIVTLPLGVLKAGAVEFAPGLPERKLDAIKKLGMGVLNKVVLRFPKAFWPEDHDFYSYISETAGEFPEFMNLQKAQGIPCLMAFTGGDFARGVEKMSDREAQDRAFGVLKKMFGASIPEPTGVKVARWGADAFAGGSYSHVPPGASGADYRALGEPVGDRLFFAGEATTAEYPGTVHGAFLTGVREAERIASLK